MSVRSMAYVNPVPVESDPVAYGSADFEKHSYGKSSEIQTEA